MFIFYRLITILFFPLLVVYIFLRILKGKEDGARIKERFACQSKEIRGFRDGAKNLIWVHAVSVGEANSAFALIDEILTQPEVVILFTTTTKTSSSIVINKINTEMRYKNRIIHQFFPLDVPFIAKKFLKFWQPRKAIFIESEIWPNFLHELRKLDIPTFLVNARMSEKSFRKWNLLKDFGLQSFENFKFIFVQNSDDVARFKALTKAEKIFFYGNLKSQAANLQFDENELMELQYQIGNRPFWLAASTHDGEEEIILEAHKELKKKFADILTIIVPRHPYRAPEITALMNDLKFSQRSKGQKISVKTEIFLADTLGELGLFYALSDVAFLGGSLFNGIGGHNPFEAVKLNCAIISGKYFFNARDAFELLIKHNGCIVINDAKGISNAVAELLADNDKLQSQKRHALVAISSDSLNVAKKIVDKVF